MLPGTDAAEAWFDEALALTRETGDLLNEREVLMWQGFTTSLSGRFHEARELVARSMDLVLELRDRFFEAYVRAVLGWIDANQGHYEFAEQHLERSLEVALETANVPAMGMARTNRGLLRVWLGRLAEAKPDLEEALLVFRATESAWVTAQILTGLGWLDMAAGRADEARPILDEALVLARQSRSPWILARALLAESRLSRLEMDIDRAENEAHEALVAMVGSSDHPGIADTLEGLAGIAAIRESWSETARLTGAASTIRRSLEYARWPILEESLGESVATSRSMLGDEAFEAAWKEGVELTVDEAVAYARRARGERKRPSSGWDSLTPTELDVVRLAAQGLTNPQIGERLFISRGTAKVHLSHIFAKLGVATRAELAAEATKRGI